MGHPGLIIKGALISQMKRGLMAHDGYRPVCMFIHNCFFVCGIFQISCSCSRNQTLFPVEVFLLLFLSCFF